MLKQQAFFISFVTVVFTFESESEFNSVLSYSGLFGFINIVV